MLRFVHALVFALVAVFGIASGAHALSSETALRANFESASDRVGGLALEALGTRQQTASHATAITSGSTYAARGAGSGSRTAQQAGISAADATRIQNAATRTNQRITVVGSRAEGTAKAGSDWDYIMSGKSSARHSASGSVPRGSGGGEVGRPGMDVWQEYNPNAPGYNVLDPSRPHVFFDP